MKRPPDSGDLFGFDPRKHARADDPITSKAAALGAVERAPKHADIVHATLRRIGPANFARMAANCGLTEAQVWRRLPDLQKAGRAEPSSVVINGKRVWEAK